MLTASVLSLFFMVILGGGTRVGFLSDVLLQFMAIPAILIAIWAWPRRTSDGAPPIAGQPSSTAGSDLISTLLFRAVLITGLVVLLMPFVPGLQSILSPGLGSRLASLGGTLPSTDSETAHLASRAAAVGALPMIALGLLVGRLTAEERIRLVGWMVGFGLFAVALGILQFSQGLGSSLRFYAFTNWDSAVGFFANRNHFAAQIYVTLLLALVWFAARGHPLFSHRTKKSARLVWLGELVSVYVLLLATLIMVQSRAGILLSIVGVAIALVLAPSIWALMRGPRATGSNIGRWVALAVAGGLIVLGFLASDRLTARFDATGVTDDRRAALTEMTLEASKDALPLGIGLGNFVPTGNIYEKGDLLVSTYANRAHDDWAEFLLEGGIPAVVFAATFLLWFAWRAGLAWFGRTDRHGRLTSLLQKVAAAAILLLLLHSFVDYPLRTTAMGGYLVVLCSFLLPPRPAPPPPTEAATR